MLPRAPSGKAQRNAPETPTPQLKLGPPRRLNFFLNGAGLDKEVILSNIWSYLGNNALIVPGSYKDPKSGQIQEGFHIAADRFFTPNHLAELKYISIERARIMNTSPRPDRPQERLVVTSAASYAKLEPTIDSEAYGAREIDRDSEADEGSDIYGPSGTIGAYESRGTSENRRSSGTGRDSASRPYQSGLKRPYTERILSPTDRGYSRSSPVAVATYNSPDTMDPFQLLGNTPSVTGYSPLGTLFVPPMLASAEAAPPGPGKYIPITQPLSSPYSYDLREDMETYAPLCSGDPSTEHGPQEHQETSYPHGPSYPPGGYPPSVVLSVPSGYGSQQGASLYSGPTYGAQPDGSFQSMQPAYGTLQPTTGSNYGSAPPGQTAAGGYGPPGSQQYCDPYSDHRSTYQRPGIAPTAVGYAPLRSDSQSISPPGAVQSIPVAHGRGEPQGYYDPYSPRGPSQGGGEEEPYDSGDLMTYEPPQRPQRERQRKKTKGKELESDI